MFTDRTSADLNPKARDLVCGKLLLRETSNLLHVKITVRTLEILVPRLHVAYRNVESLGLFGYEHKVFNLKRAPPLSLTTFLPSISGLEELQSYNKFIPQVLWLKYSNKRKRRNIAVKQSGF